jgi:hypothetical protein
MLLSALVAALFAPAQATAESSGCAVVNQESYRVKIVPQRVHYTRGDIAVIGIKVTRRGTAQPVQAAEVYAGLYQPASKAYNVRQAPDTDATGRSIVRLKVHREFQRGRMDVLARAQTRYADAQTACVDANEYGFTHKRRAFHVGR